MGESLITRKSGSGGSGSGEFRTEIITSNINWVVPKSLKNKAIRVVLFGGGQSGCSYSFDGGGGSGMMANAVFTNLTPGQIIPITIGIGGSNANDEVYESGGSSFFGSYLSANGGGGGGLIGGRAFQGTYTNSDCDGGGGCGYVKKTHLLNPETIAGNQDFLSPSRETENGHKGGGAAQISWLPSQLTRVK